jgi:hypothetical protein
MIRAYQSEGYKWLSKRCLSKSFWTSKIGSKQLFLRKFWSNAGHFSRSFQSLLTFQPGKSASKVGRGGAAWGPVAPKYRNPGNPAETWAGRGLKPRWLTAAIASGKKLEDFAIAAPTAKSGPAKAGKAARKKPRKAKKSSKK